MFAVVLMLWHYLFAVYRIHANRSRVSHTSQVSNTGWGITVVYTNRSRVSNISPVYRPGCQYKSDEYNLTFQVPDSCARFG